MIKANLREWYSAVKRDIPYHVIFASQKSGREDLVAGDNTVDRLLTIDGFRVTFEGGREGHEGFYAFRNYMSDDTPEYRKILLNLGILPKQIDYVLHNYSIADRELFDFFKHLKILLFRLKEIGPGYDEEKVLSRFIREIFAGWNWVEGYRGYDIVEKMIEDI